MPLFTWVIFLAKTMAEEALYQVTENELIKCTSLHTKTVFQPRTAGNKLMYFYAIGNYYKFTATVFLPRAPIYILAFFLQKLSPAEIYHFTHNFTSS